MWPLLACAVSGVGAQIYSSTPYATSAYLPTATYSASPYVASSAYLPTTSYLPTTTSYSATYSSSPFVASSAYLPAALPAASYLPTASSFLPASSYLQSASYFASPAGNSLDEQQRQQAVLNVVAGVNYALSLENLEAAFYRAVNQILSSDSDYLRLTTGGTGQFNPATLHSRFIEIGSHEAAHVVALNQLVNTLCALIPGQPCQPVPPCTYNFDLGNINAFDKNINTIIGVADLLENTGVSAYDGAISSLIQTHPLTNDINSPSDFPAVVQSAATIATVEARHAAFIGTVRGADPFPSVTDTPLKPQQVLCAARKFVVNPSTCPLFNTVAC